MFDVIYGKYDVVITLLEDSILPEIKTSAIRGGLGQVLLEDYCINNKKCDLCKTKDLCIYKNVFNKDLKVIPEKIVGEASISSFVINCDDYKSRYKAGRDITFELIIIGDAITLAPIIFKSIEKLGERGLGTNLSKFQVAGIYNEENNRVFYKGKTEVDRIYTRTFNDYADKNKIDTYAKLEFLTPFRYKKNGRFTDEITSEDIIISINRRLGLINALVGNSYDNEINTKAVLLENTLKWDDSFERYSSRQNGRMKFGGVKGACTLKNLTDIEKRLLIAGQLVGIGKNTSFGLGRYRLEGE